MVLLENGLIKAEISEKGGELISLFHKENRLEYLWQADPAFWGRHAPILFPVVGALKQDQYTYRGKAYSMPRHGFARDMPFTLHQTSPRRVSCYLCANEETRKMYPFDFKLTIYYHLESSGIKVRWRIENPSEEPMYFSIGAHPAFNIPLVENLAFDDYYLQFSPSKSRVNIPLKGGLLDWHHRTLAQTNTAWKLSHELFKNDAEIFAAPGKQKFMIAADKDPRRISLAFDDFDFVGVWSPYPKEAPFVCLEPWCGIADAVDATGDLTQKLAIHKLDPHQIFEREYSITIE